MAYDAFRGGREGRITSKPGPIELRIPDIPLWAPDSAVAVMQEQVRLGMELALQRTAAHIADHAGQSSDTGALAQSFMANPSTVSGGIEVTGTSIREELTGRVFSSLPYAIVVNDGRKPGPINRAGIDAIGLWAQRKLGLSADQAERAKWAIATEIRLRGTAGTDYFTKGVSAARPEIDATLSEIADAIAQSLAGVAPA